MIILDSFSLVVGRVFFSQMVDYYTGLLDHSCLKYYLLVRLSVFKILFYQKYQLLNLNAWQVVIYSPARAATQQGSGKLGKWRINFMSTQKYVYLSWVFLVG